MEEVRATRGLDDSAPEGVNGARAVDDVDAGVPMDRLYVHVVVTIPMSLGYRPRQTLNPSLNRGLNKGRRPLWKFEELATWSAY